MSEADINLKNAIRDKAKIDSEVKELRSQLMAAGDNIREHKEGPRFPIVHALRFHRVAVALQAHMPAVHPEMTIWGGEGRVPPIFFAAKYYFFLN